MARKKPDLLSLFDSYAKSPAENDPLVLEAMERMKRRQEEEEERARLAARPDFSGVTTSVDTTGGDPSTSEPSGLDSLLGRLGTAVSGGWDSTVGGGMRQAGARLYTSGDTSSGYPSLLEMLPSTSLLASAYEAIPDEYKKGVGAGMFRKGGAQAQEAYTAMEEAFPVAGGAVADALASPSSHISILGGPVGAAVGFQSAFDSTYTQGRLDGLSEGEAAALATGDGIIEGGMSIIPTGKYLDKLPGMDKMAGPLKDYLKGRLANVATRVGKTMAGEAVQEGATEIGQLAWQKLMAEAGPTEKLQEYSKEQLPATTTEFWNQVMRAAKAGAAGGGMIQTPTTILQDMQQSGKIAGDVLNMYANEQKDNRSIPSNETGPIVPPDTKLNPEQAAEIRAAQEDLAWQTRDEERANEQAQQTRLDNQADLRNSFVSQVDTARSRVEAAQDSIEAGDTSPSTLNEALSAQRQLERAEARLSSFEASMAAPAATPEVPATTPRLDVYGEPVGPAMPADVQAKQESVREDVRKSIEARQAREQKAKENAHKKARKAFIDEQLEANANLPAEQQETAVTRAALEWDNNNPVDTFVPAEKPKAGRRTPTPKAATAEAPKITAAEQLAQMRKEAGFSSLTSTDNGSDTQLSSREVAEAVVEKMGKGDNRKAAVLLAEGKVALVDNAADIPSGAVETNTGAFYDAKTGQTYVVANNLQKGKPIVGQLLDRAAHEFKHAGDLSGNADLQGGGLSKFIGVENNEKIVSQIEDAAAKGDPVAIRALERAKNATQDKPTYTLELPAYFVEESRSARRNSTVVNNITRNILSATRSTVKGIIPGDYEVNLNDVAYLSDKLIERTALTQGSLAATGANAERAGFSSEGLNMIQGPTSARFKEAQDNGWVYTSMDGKEKFVTSDAGSTMDRASVRDLLKLPHGEGFFLRDLIIHEELFRDYPHLQEIPVVIDKTDSLNAAEYNAASNGNDEYISVRSDYVQDALKSRKAMDELRGLILHETQHAVQEIENSARGGNPSMFITPLDRQTRTKLGNRLRAFDAARMESLAAIKTAGEGGFGGSAQMLRDIVLDYNDKNLTMSEVTSDLISVLENIPETEQSKPLYDIVRNVDRIREVQPAISEMNKRTLADYMDLLGEREARFTETNLNKTQDQLPHNPEDVNDPKGFVEENVREARRYEGEATLRMSDEDTDASVFRRASAKPRLTGLASKTQAWAEDYFGDKKTATNFTKWFDGSQVVNEDGTPKIQFHGTYTPIDFDTFKPGENEIGIHVGTIAQANDPAFVGDIYSNSATDSGREDRAPRTIPLFVDIKNPLPMPDVFGNASPLQMSEEIKTAALRQGADTTTPKAVALFNKLQKGGDLKDAATYAKELGFDGLVYSNEGEGFKSSKNTSNPESRLYHPQATDSSENSYVVFDASQLKSTTGNDGEYSPQQLSFLRSEVPEYNVPSLPQSDADGRARATARFLGRLLIPDANVPTKVAEAIRFARGSQAGTALNSDILTNNMRLALESARQELKRNGVDKSNEQIRKELYQDIQEINKLATREERAAAVKKLDEKYPIRTDALRTASPTLSKAIFDIHEAKRAFTAEVIAERSKGTPLSEAEVALFSKILKNDETYNTRAYLSTYNKEIGKEYGETLLERAHEDNTSDEARRVSTAVEYLVEHDLMVPPKNELMRKPIEKVRHMYEAWGLGNGNTFTSRDGKEAMVDALQEKVGASRAEMEALAMESIMDMLGLTTKPKKGRKDALKVARADQTIVTARKDMPAPLRELLGEITDPILQEKLTLHRMGSFVAKTRMMNELFERGKGDLWSDTQSDLFKEQLGSDAGFGPLAGKFLHPDLHYALSAVMTTHDTVMEELGEAIRNPAVASQVLGRVYGKSMRAVVGAQKSAQVVMNPVNMVFNIIGSVPIAGMNGIGPMTALKGMQLAGSALLADVSLNTVINDNLHQMAVEATTHNVIDSASVGMFQSEFHEGLRKELRAQAAKGQQPNMLTAGWSVLKKSSGTTKDFIRNLYAFMDVWVKAATYVSRKDYWNKMNQYENMGLSELDIQRKASWDASNTNLSYDRAMPIARTAEQLTPIAVFATYFTESMIRVPLMNYAQVGKEFHTAMTATSPEARKLAAAEGTKRLLGTTLATAGIILGTLRYLDSEDEDKKAARALDPDYYRNSIMVQIGTDKDGKPRYYSLNRADALGPLNELVVAVAKAPDERKFEAFNQGLRDLLITSKAVTDIIRLVGDAGAAAFNKPEWDQKGKTSWIKKSFPEYFNMMTQFEGDGDIPENLFTLIDTLTPTLFKGAVDDERDVIGFKPYVRDAEKSMGFRIYDYDKAVKKQRSNFQSFLEGNPTPDQVLRRMNGIVEKEKPAFDDLSKAVNGLLSSQKHEGKPELGKYTLSDGARIFRKEKKADIYRYAVRGEFKSSVIDPKELSKWYKRQMKRKDVDRKQLNETYRMALRSYRSVMMKDNDNED